MSDPMLVVADSKQNIFDLPGFYACGQAGEKVSLLPREDLIPLPPGSKLFFFRTGIPSDSISTSASMRDYETFIRLRRSCLPATRGCLAPRIRKERALVRCHFFHTRRLRTIKAPIIFRLSELIAEKITICAL